MSDATVAHELDRRYVLTVEQGDHGQRLDIFVARGIGDLSRTHGQKFIRKGLVWVNGEIVDTPSSRVFESDTVEVLRPGVDASTLTPVDVGLKYLYVDDDIAVIDKPEGLLVHPGAGSTEPTALHGMLFRWPEHAAQFDSEYADRPGVVHRLDRDTSGVVVIARNELARQSLVHQFANRTVSKHYLAVVYGAAPETAAINRPIGRNAQDRKRFTTKNPVDPRPAQTHIDRMAQDAQTTLLSVQILTGRTHQIRVHLSDSGWPVVGDPWYGHTPIKASRLMLHAWRLAFTHPRTAQPIAFESQPQGHFQQWIEKHYGHPTLEKLTT